MITEVRLNNFRGFDQHILPFKETTLVVGRNNAGKSSLVEALRLVSIITSRFRSLGYREGPSWGGIPRREYGVSPSLKGLEINFPTIFHRYGDPPAIISTKFANGAGIKIYLGNENQLHAVILDRQGSPIKTKAAALEMELPAVEILPQIGPLEKGENILSTDYVRGALSSSLASKHFRNQLRIFHESFPEFRRMVEATWPGLQVLELEGANGFPGDPLYLQLRDEDFVAEIALMGHGLQMWLQTIWFLARSAHASTIILDEPDVYMHPDLQRRLVRFVKKQFRQIIIATHSVEIMSEVEPDEILIVDRRRKQSRFASSIPAVQKLIDHVGSVHNIQFAKLWSARRCILVEGKDMKLISAIHSKLFPESESFATVPNLPLGGWGGWQYAIGSSLFLQNAGGEAVTVYCVLDSDYHSEAAIERRKLQAAQNNVQLHIWSRKEIENYFLLPSAIHRIITTRRAARTTAPTIDEIRSELDRITESLKDEVFDAMSAEILAENRSLGAAGANRETRKILQTRWASAEGRLATISGKEAFSRLSSWSQEQFGVAISPGLVAREMIVSEIDEELLRVVRAMELSEPFLRSPKQLVENG